MLEEDRWASQVFFLPRAINKAPIAKPFLTGIKIHLAVIRVNATFLNFAVSS